MAALTEEVSKTYTNWKAFDQASLAPAEIRCDGYLPVHPSNEGCHTVVKNDNVDTIINHLENHGGGFVVKMRYTEKSKTPIWSNLQNAKIEIHDFRCEWCNADVKLNPQHLRKHMEPHLGGNRRIGGNKLFFVTLRNTPPLNEEEE